MCPILYAAAGLLGMSLVGISVEPAAPERSPVPADTQHLDAKPCEVSPCDRQDRLQLARRARIAPPRYGEHRHDRIETLIL
jgi:hypothetical protein